MEPSPGKGLTDDDHTYNLKVRFSGNHINTKEINVALKTYKTARITFDSQDFTFTSQGTQTANLTSSSDQPLTFALQPGSSLPAWMSLNSSTGTLTSTGQYSASSSDSVLIRATSQHNQTGVVATIEFEFGMNQITVPATSITFIKSRGTQSKGVSYRTSRYQITPVYQCIGSLPAGITFDSATGQFRSDASFTGQSTSSVQVRVSSSTGHSLAGTGTIAIILKLDVDVPNDFDIYIPLTEPYGTSQYGGHALSWTGSDATADTIGWTGCTRLNTSYFRIADATFDYSHDGMISFILIPTSNQTTWAYILAASANADLPRFQLKSSKQFELRWFSSDINGTISLGTNDKPYMIWMQWNATDQTVSLYVDGVLDSTASMGSNRMFENLEIGARRESSKPCRIGLAQFLKYDRILTASEKQGLIDLMNRHLTASDQSMTFSINQSGSKKITYSTSTPLTSCTVSSGTLPSWATLDTDGTIHGTPTAQATVSLGITMVNSQGCTRTITLTIQTRDSGIPTDYVFYHKLQSNTATAQTGQQMTYQSSPTPATYKGLDCLHFQRNKVYANDMTGMPTGSNPWSFSFWACIQSISTSQYILSIGREYQNSLIQVCRYNGFNLGPGWVDFTAGDVQADVWHHWTQTYDGSTLRYYKDGVLIGTRTWTGAMSYGSTQGIVIGSFFTSTSSNSPMDDGYLAGLRVYNRVLTQQQITALAQEHTPIQ